MCSCVRVCASICYLCSYSCGVFVISTAATEVHSKPVVELADIKVKVSFVEDTSPAENEWDGKTIKVCGLQPATSDHVIKSFFQNKNRSSGGYIKMFDIDRNNGVAYVTFVTAGGLI